MQKNDVVTVKIEDIGNSGEGIGKIDGYTLFIKDSIIGDVVEARIMKAKKNYAYAKLLNVVTPSEYRVEHPACQVVRSCGGCQIQDTDWGDFQGGSFRSYGADSGDGGAFCIQE